MSLYAELKRRNVFRVAAAYIVLGWLFLQVSSVVLQFVAAPDWVGKAIIALLVIGFIPSLAIAWVFEIGPNGVQRDDGSAPAANGQHARRLDILTLIGVVLVAVIALAEQLRVPEEKGTQGVEAAATTSAGPETAAVAAKSIAVLPFADLSPAHDQEYFSDGVAEEILNALAQVPDLKVAGRTSSFYFKGRNESLPTIGAALGVATVLEGSVRKQGDKVRITAQLIRVDNGFHMWSQSYDGELTDVFELQERIARAITDALQVVLEGDQKTRLAPQTTRNVEAYQQFLRGRYFFDRRGYANLQLAVAAFRAALDLDPAYADAWGGLARTYAVMDNYASVEMDGAAWKSAIPDALAAAEQALSLQADLGSALTARAFVRVQEFDWTGAEADYRAAIAHNPRDPGVRVWYAQFFMNQRRWREAAVQAEQAFALDPLSPIVNYNLGWLKDAQADFAGAIPHHDEALRLVPGLYVALANKVMDLVDLGDYDLASAAAHEMPADQRDAFLGVIAALRDPSLVDDATEHLLSHPLGGTDQPWALARLGQHDHALAELEHLFRERSPYRAYLFLVPAFRPLYADPRFQALVLQMGLPQPAAQEAPPSS